MHSIVRFSAIFLLANGAGGKIADKQAFLVSFLAEHKPGPYNYYSTCLSRDRKIRLLKTEKRVSDYYVNFISSTDAIDDLRIHFLISDADCLDSVYLRNLSDNSMFNAPYKHLILSSNYSNLVGHLTTLDISVSSFVIVATFHANKTVSMTVVYRVSANSSLVSESYGRWWSNVGETRGRHLELTPQVAPLTDRRKNLRKQSIRVGGVLFQDKHITKYDYDDIRLLTYNEVYYLQDMPVFHALIQGLNATMVLRIYDSYGYPMLNKTTGQHVPDGVVKDLILKELDISLALFMRKERIDWLKPIAPIDLWNVNFFLKKPSLSFVKNIYVITLSTSTWIATFITTLLFVTVLYVALKWEYKKNRRSSYTRTISWSDMYLLSFEALCQQGTVLSSSSLSVQLILFLLFLLFMFVYVAYSANILVLLRSTADVHSLADLLEGRRWSVGLVNLSYIRTYAGDARGEVLRQLYSKKIKPNNNLFEKSVGLEKVRAGSFALFSPIVSSYKYFLKNYTNFEICMLQELPGYMNLKAYPFAPKSSGYAELYKARLLSLRERGIVYRAKYRLVTKPQCNNQAGNFQSVGIYDCMPILLTFIYGMLLSLLLVSVEKVVNKLPLLNR